MLSIVNNANASFGEKMLRLFIFLAFGSFILIQMACNEPVCLPQEQNLAYLYIPNKNGSLDCNQTPCWDMDTIQEQHGGKVAVVRAHNSNKPKFLILSPAAVPDHAINAEYIVTSDENHDDEVARNSSLEEQESSLTRTPTELKNKWMNYDQNITYGDNGCGIWATAVCNRILGLTSGPLTQEEWNKTASDLGFLPAQFGITPFYYIASYYQNKGFCSETKPLEGLREEYVEMKEKLKSGCDLKLFFARKSKFWFTPAANPHIETIVDVVVPTNEEGQAYLFTNSWGTYAKISGGSCTEFSHERNKAFAQGASDGFAWPPNDARVWVQTTCNCDILGKHVTYAEELAAAK